MCRAAALLACVLSAGCLVPQDVEAIDQRIHKPPRIVIESISPIFLQQSIDLVRAGGTGCRCRVTFSIPTVEEPDVTADLEARWFVDYDASAAPEPFFTRYSMDGTFDFTKTTRRVPDHPVDPEDLADGFHTVDVVIAEKAAFNDVRGVPAPMRTLKSGYEAAVFRFVVRVVTDPDVPQCTESPFERVCP